MRGSVLWADDRAPVPFAEVTIVHETTRGVAKEAITDENGGFKVSGLAAGSYHVIVRGEGVAQFSDALSVGRVRSRSYELLVEPGRRLRGKVVDVAGQPVAW